MSVAVMVATCAIPDHPRTRLIEHVITNVRHHFPDCTIYIGADGLAPYQLAIPGRVENYDEFCLRMRDDVVPRHGNIVFRRFAARTHQTGMTAWVLSQTDADFFLFNEHDCPLMIDRPIAWPAILSALQNNLCNVVRMPWWEEDGVHPEHRHLSIGEFQHEGSRFIRTKQWSGWPHIATTLFYRRMFRQWIPEGTVSMIENVVDGAALAVPDFFRVALWVGENPTARFNHLDGRTNRDNGVRDERDA